MAEFLLQVPREFLVQTLNRIGSGREYAELEARVCLYLDVDKGRVRSLTAYASQWQWHKSTVHRRWSEITRDVWNWCSWYGRAPDNPMARKYLDQIPGSASTAFEPERNADGTLVQHDGTKNGVSGADSQGCGTETERSRNGDGTHPKQTLSPKTTAKEKDVLRTSKKKGWPDDLVEEVYQCYPRKVKKQAALKAIPAALDRIAAKDEPPEDPVRWLKDRVRKFAESPAGNNGVYTPHPATWFNAGQYDDDDSEWFKTKKNGRQRPDGESPTDSLKRIYGIASRTGFEER